MSALDTTTARQLAEAATAGDWWGEACGDGQWDLWFANGEFGGQSMVGTVFDAADAAFVTAARSLVPALCDELDAARAELVKERAANSAITAANRVLGARLAGFESPPKTGDA